DLLQIGAGHEVFVALVPGVHGRLGGGGGAGELGVLLLDLRGGDVLDEGPGGVRVLGLARELPLVVVVGLLIGDHGGDGGDAPLELLDGGVAPEVPAAV